MSETQPNFGGFSSDEFEPGSWGGYKSHRKQETYAKGSAPRGGGEGVTELPHDFDANAEVIPELALQKGSDEDFKQEVEGLFEGMEGEDKKIV